MEAAAQRAAHLAKTEEFSHDGWKEAVLQTNYPGFLRSENIAMGYFSVKELFDDWLDSPGHRRNLLDIEPNQVGIGCAVGEDGSFWWSQIFGIAH
jgi:uncharacterized protein YkwD